MSVRVVARIRPLLPKEVDKETIVSAASSDENKAPTLVKIPNPKNESEEFSFAFNGVYDQSITQENLFTAEGKQGLDYEGTEMRTTPRSRSIDDARIQC